MKKPSLPFRISLPAAAMALSMLVIGAGVGYAIGSRARTIDWSATGAFLQGLAALLAAAVAAWGVNRWQQELRYKRNSELAEKVMVCVEALGDTIKGARRAPVKFDAHPDYGDWRVLDISAYKERLGMLEEKNYAAEVRSQVHRVGVLLGQPYRASLESVLAVYDDLREHLQLAIWQAQVLRAKASEGENCVDLLREFAPTLFEPKDRSEKDIFGERISYAFADVRRRFHKDL